MKSLDLNLNLLIFRCITLLGSEITLHDAPVGPPIEQQQRIFVVYDGRLAVRRTSTVCSLYSQSKSIVWK
jgi:hypothetical protein